jgi:RND superfamily putative drug exporter
MRETLPYRWSRVVQHHPWRSLAGGTIVLLILAAPVLSLRLGFSDEGNFAKDTTTRRAYDLLSEGFGPGFNGPLIGVVTIATPADAAALQGLSAAIGADPGVQFASPALPNSPTAPTAAVIQIIPKTSPQDKATSDTINRLRGEVVPTAIAGTSLTVYITGSTAASMDFTSYLSERLVVFIGVVLLLSFLLLMMVFRSLLVPLKAVIMNVLSIAAAYGVVVAIFQWGWLSSVFGIEPAPIEPFVPMMMFAIVFGLSMDYEVFLLSRVKEEYDRTGDAKSSVADGLAATAQVITAAAAIMIVVFGAFLLEDTRVIKLFGVGLAVAVLLDATLVRLLLVPATMELLGDKNWWLPKWLDRILPHLNVEGPAVHEGIGANAVESPDDEVIVPDDDVMPDGDSVLSGR